MILCIDIGNTKIKFGLFNYYNIKCREKLSIKTKDLNENNIQQKFKEYIHKIKKIIISSVVPGTNKKIKSNIEGIFGIEPIFINLSNLNIDVKDNKNLGADRIANIIGAYNLYPEEKNWMIIDFGTATTICLVNKSEYLGGLIFPGIKTQISSINNNTQIKENITMKAENLTEYDVLKNGTENQISFGINYMHYATIKSICNKIKKQLPKTKIIATGGYGKLFNNLVEKIEPELTLIGLYFIALKN